MSIPTYFRTQVVLMDSEDMLRTIARNLEYNRDARGRHLVRDVDLPQLRLRKGWRLEPSRSLPDVAQFEFQAVPFEATFWVAPRTARLTHSCPLYLYIGRGQPQQLVDRFDACLAFGSSTTAGQFGDSYLHLFWSFLAQDGKHGTCRCTRASLAGYQSRTVPILQDSSVRRP